MEELIKTFHVDAKLIIAQLINFAIVLFVLKKFAYAPMVKLMNERSGKIEKGLKDAQDAHKKLSEITEKERAILVEAKKQAQEIVSKAEAVAARNKEEIIAEAKAHSEKMLSDAEKRMEQEKNRMMQEVKGQIAGLVVAATEKVIAAKIDGDKDKELIAEAIK